MIFLENKYTKWYFHIINNAQNRIVSPDVYYEKHHITPKSIGGDNISSNLILLTAREHFVCHLLLTKMTSGLHKSKMTYALNMMLVKRNNCHFRYLPRSKIYEITRKLNSLEQQKKKVSQETKNKIGKAHKGKILSEETKNKIKNAKIGKPGRKQSPQEKLARSKARLGSNLSPETKNKIGKAHKGKIISEEQKIKMEKTRKEKYESRKILVLISPNGEIKTQNKKETAEFFCNSLGIKYQTVKLSFDLNRKMRNGWKIVSFK